MKPTYKRIPNTYDLDGITYGEILSAIHDHIREKREYCKPNIDSTIELDMILFFPKEIYLNDYDYNTLIRECTSNVIRLPVPQQLFHIPKLLNISQPDIKVELYKKLRFEPDEIDNMPFYQLEYLIDDINILIKQQNENLFAVCELKIYKLSNLIANRIELH